uniref:Uncharacterized protein n=1 Tax=Avena sativa TaxID=4498 RepID=A0ACD5ZZX1_AVESA
MMALDLPLWLIHLLNKLARGFFWAGLDCARRGQCVVAWDSVCTPVEYGGLGFLNLKLLNNAFRSKWLWEAKTSDNLPWTHLDLAVSKEARAIFHASVRIELHDGRKSLFWTDPWISGLSIQDIAPALFAFVKPKAARIRLVADARVGSSWMRDLSGYQTVGAILQYLRIWELIAAEQPLTVGEDKWIWKWTSSGIHSCKSAYSVAFEGRINCGWTRYVWKPWAPMKFKLFF